ncbi:MAG: alpha-rhamnosidase, partial [Bacteroidaceae bacterium]|nr:alpha-rhamnosidase [Bacteroidaceae bacterium]
RHYDSMRRWLDYARRHMRDGLLHRWSDEDYRWWYLGDWATPDGVNPTDERSVSLVGNCVLSICLQTMSRIARVLDKPSDADAFAKEAEQLNTRIHHTFYNADSHTYATATQTDMALPMLSGATPSSELPLVAEAFRRLTREQFRGHLHTGLVGIPVVTEWVTRHGEAQLMYEMLKKRDKPGYLYMIDHEGTTTWEYWHGRRSYIHNCYNGIGTWFYEALAGIQPDASRPGYRHFYVCPQPVDGISWVRATVPTPQGEVRVEWHKTEAGAFTLQVHIPIGSEATIRMPGEAGKEQVLGSGDHTLRV